MKHVEYQGDLLNLQTSRSDTSDDADGIPSLDCGRCPVLHSSTLSARSGYEALSASFEYGNLR